MSEIKEVQEQLARLTKQVDVISRTVKRLMTGNGYGPKVMITSIDDGGRMGVQDHVTGSVRPYNDDEVYVQLSCGGDMSDPVKATVNSNTGIWTAGPFYKSMTIEYFDPCRPATVSAWSMTSSASDTVTDIELF